VPPGDVHGDRDQEGIGRPDYLEHARGLIAQGQRVVVLTGAGISTDSGIPDFRGPDGVWTRDPGAERLATLQAYVNDPGVRQRAWRNRLASPTWNARPNAGHMAIVELERRGRLSLLVTQNVDGLHQDAGTDPDRVVEIHGTMRHVVCLRCGDRHPAAQTLARVRAGDGDPHCLVPGPDGHPCAGILKSATISFGQQLVARDLVRAETAAATCDVLVAVGSTLAVHPAAGLVPVARQAGATVVIVNVEATEMDAIAHTVVRGPISDVLPALLG